MKTKVVYSEELTPRSLKAKDYLDPEMTVRLSFQADAVMKFRGEVGGDEYNKVLAALGNKLGKLGVRMGGIDGVEDLDE